MSLWNLHRAAVKTETAGAAQGEQGKPRPVINATLCIGCGSCVDACPETGTLALVTGKAILAHPDRCVGHAKCVQVCPTSALSLAFGSTLQTLRAPLVKETFETNVAGIYIAGELSGMGLIKTAINEGRMAIDSFHEPRRRQRGGRRLGRLGRFLRGRSALLAFGGRRLGEDVAARQRDVALARETLDELPPDDLLDRARRALYLDAVIALEERRYLLACRAEKFRDLVNPDSCQR